MRVLITGASGQIGTNLGISLRRDGHEVIGVDHRPNQWVPDLTHAILDLAEVVPIGRWQFGSVHAHVDAVVHLAAHAKVHALVERPLGALENHLMVTNALEFARVNNVPILLASSREVYGNGIIRGTPVPETAADFRAAPSPYAAMKLASEALAASYRRCYDTPFSVIRYSNVYGRYDHDLDRLERAIWIFRDQLARGQPVTVFGLDKTLDFTYIDDAVRATRACLQALVDGAQAVVGQTFNVAHGSGHTLVEVVEIIARSIGRVAEIRIEPARPGEVTWYVADISRARDAFGYIPTTSVTTGIPQAIAEASLLPIDRADGPSRA